MKVSVATITYNHETFIEEALDSVLAQEVDFDLEIVVSDDCSTDRTGEIVARYADEHPGVVKAVRNETNLGAHTNWVRTLARCEGDYIALLDGDDYWTAPHKLRRQRELLDRDRDAVLVFHPAEVCHEDGTSHFWFPPRRRDRYELGDLLRGNFIATSSVMYRNLRLDFPDWYDEAAGMPGDWLLFCLHARHGSIAYIDEVMSAYRQHHAGIWSGAPEERIRRLRSLIEIGERLNEDLDGAYTASVRRQAMAARAKIAVERLPVSVVEPLMGLRSRLRVGRRRPRRAG